MATTRDLVTERFDGQGNSRVYRIRNNGTTIVESWSCWQGSSSGGKLLYRTPTALHELAVRQAAGQLAADEQDCRAMIEESNALRDQEPICVLRTGSRVQ